MGLWLNLPGSSLEPIKNPNKNKADALPDEFYKNKYERVAPRADRRKASYTLGSIIGAGTGFLPGVFAADKVDRKYKVPVLAGTMGLGATIASIITYTHNKKVEKENSVPNYELDDDTLRDIKYYETYNYGTDPLDRVPNKLLEGLWGLCRKKNA